MFIRHIRNDGGVKISEYEAGKYRGCSCYKNCDCWQRPVVLSKYYRARDTRGRKPKTEYFDTLEEAEAFIEKRTPTK